MSNVVACLSVLLVCCIPALSATAANVEIEKMDGVVGGSKIPVGTEISFYIRITNTFPDTIKQIANGFRIYSPDGAAWFPHSFIDSSLAITGEWIYDSTLYGRWVDSMGEGGRNWNEAFDLWNAVSYTSSNQQMGDTAGFWGLDAPSCQCEGIGPDSEVIAWKIVLDSVANISLGRQLCIDSSAFGGLPWSWFNGGIHIPTWGGPYCFEIVADCCEGFRGNINLDWQDQIDISDLTSLVGWMFKSGSAPPCMLEADVDGNSDHDIADVTHLVGYMFKGGPEPAGCPQ